MADNINVTQGSGTTIATDDIGGVQYQRVKLSQGADGSATDVSSAAPLQVTLANTGANATAVKVDGSAVTQPVSGTVTASAQPGVDIGDVTINNASGASAVNIQDGGNSITVDGTVAATQSGTWNVTNISGTVSLPTGASTLAEQQTQTTSLQLLDDVIVTDNGAFVDGTTKLSMGGFIFDETAGTALTENDAAAARVNSNRAQIAVLEDPTTRGRYATVTAANALKVDGSAVTQPVSGTVAVSTINSVAPAFGSGVRGATVQRVTIATDDVVPASQSGTWSIPVTTATASGTVTMQNAVAATGNGTTLTTTGYGTAVMQISGTFVATITFEGSVDAGTTWFGMLATQIGNSSISTTATTTGIYRVNCSGIDLVRARVTWTSGTSVTVTGRATNAVNAPKIAQTLGNIAHDGVDSGNPVKIGGRARSSEITAVANDDRTDFVTDLVGKQIVLPYANPENFVSGAITTSMTGTTSTSLIAAPGAGLRNYITTIIVSNAHATVGTDVVIQDGSGGTTLLTIPAAAVYGGAVINLPVPLRQPTANTAIFCANVTTGASTKVSAVGYRGA